MVTVTFLGYGAYWFSAATDRQPPKSIGEGESAALVSSFEKVTAEKVIQTGEDGKPVLVSSRLLDFGRVPLRFPVNRTLSLLSQAKATVFVAGIRAGQPFGTDPASLILEPGVAAEINLTFEPERPGVYEERITLAFGEPLERDIDVVLRGEGIPSPLDLNLPIPPPPDLAVRQHREQELARLLEEARSQQLAEGSGSPVEREGEDTTKPEGDEGSGSEPDARSSARQGGSGTSPPPLPVVLAAFGVPENPADDPNRVPVPIPEGDTKPNLPPVRDDSRESEPEAGQETQKDDSGDGGGAGDQGSSEAKKIPTFTVAPNSSVLVFSSRESLDLQAFPVRLTPDGSVFQVEGRIRFPELAMAFGQNVGVKQFDNLVGTLAPDGSVQMNLTLRLDDPGGVVLDLPVPLTTGMAVGYSAEGRVMFANGIARDPSTGDVKLVGIANIPLGAGSALDKAPVFVEILGRLELF